MTRILVVGSQRDIDDADYPGVLIIRLGGGKVTYTEFLEGEE